MDLDPGTVVANRYRIGRPLGRGGMGEVFAAENIRTGRPVAIKLLRQDSKQKSSAIARFRQEARAAGSINSDHVTQVLDVEEDPEHGVVIVFELLEGESLIDRLKRTGPVPFDELHAIIEQVWLGLADAHRAGIIHRDLKPSNVFLERRPDGTTRVKILDFGISKVPKEVGGETLTEMGQSLGTFSFMPPEQIGKAKLVDHRADIYACATLIFQSLTGQLPYAARNILLMVEAKSKADARKLGDVMAGAVDPRLDAFVARGLARDPAHRFQTALEALALWRELRPGSAALPVVPPASPAPVPPAGATASYAGGYAPLPAAQTPLPQVVPHATPAPAIVDAPHAPHAPPKLPSVADLTTEESMATLAMRRPQIASAPGPAGVAPRLEPRLDPQINIVSSRGVGPGGTQLVVVSRTPATPPPPRTGVAGPDEPTVGEDKSAARAGGYYPPPAAQPRATVPMPATPVPPPYAGDAGIPRVYDDPPSPPVPGNESDGVATRVYRPTGDTSGRFKVDPALQAITPPAPAKPQVPVWMLLIGFLMVGFVAVAGVIWLLKGR